MNKKRALCFVAFFSLIALLIFVFLGIALDRDNSQLSSLLKSDYEYSVMTRNPVGQDDYYLFDADISFALSADASSSINADVIMQVSESDYSDSVEWNAGHLNETEVAISESVSRSYGLAEGDIIYSKHVVNNTLVEYKVAQILPEVATIRTEKMKNYINGIIVMGSDDAYLNNLSYKYLSYTSASIQELEANAPEAILYREDEIFTVLKSMAPYIIVFSVIMIVLVCALVVLMTKNIEHNFKRLAILGFEKKALDKSYLQLVGGITAASLAFPCVISLIGYKILQLCFCGIWISLALTVIGAVSLIVMIFILRWRLWRE